MAKSLHCRALNVNKKSITEAALPHHQMPNFNEEIKMVTFSFLYIEKNCLVSYPLHYSSAEPFFDLTDL